MSAQRPEAGALARAVAAAARPLRGEADDFDPLLALARDARCVLIGEATHGTHEFYHVRAELTKRLIEELGFCGVAVEADWPDAYRVNRWVRGLGSDESAEEALRGFRRFPAWMWRNTDVVEFIDWLRAHNDEVEAPRRAGFYGLDLYSLHASIDAVLEFLYRVDPQAAERARRRYACFESFGDDAQAYGYATSLGVDPDCQHEAVSQLLDLQSERANLLRRDGLELDDDVFAAEQNAAVVKNAEEYYRKMFGGHVEAWNLRDTHMADTLDALLVHLARRFEAPKLVEWAHNSHLGDARATEMGKVGEVNVGRLVRERHPGQALLIGATTYQGSVTAARDWGRSAEVRTVRPALPGSCESLFHETGVPDFLLVPEALRADGIDEPLLQRAIGVVYRPESERLSHYFHVRLASQFDAVLHLDETRAVEPLERSVRWDREEPAETYPTGM